MSLPLQIDPETRDIVIDEHGAVFVDEPTPELLLAIGVRRSSLWQDPDQVATSRPSRNVLKVCAWQSGVDR